MLGVEATVWEWKPRLTENSEKKPAATPRWERIEAIVLEALRPFVEAREAVARALAGVCTVEHCATLDEAVRAAARAAQPGDTVLLSPACASLDMFRDYVHRGAVFAQAVKELPA